MRFQPEVNYNPDLKVWSGVDEDPIFNPNLSLGEIIFTEMQRHPQLIAQVRQESLLSIRHCHHYISLTDFGYGEYRVDP